MDKQLVEATILDEAKDIIYGARARDYGHPSKNFQNIADLWNGYLSVIHRERHKQGAPITSLTNVDIACLNILQKVARLASNPTHRDSMVDIAGYAGTIERIICMK